MHLNCYSIRDTKAEAFNTPFYMKTNGEALRAFTDLANDPASTINKHPADYCLYHLGSFDTDTGTFNGTGIPTSLGFASDFARPNPQLQLLNTQEN